MSGGPGVPMEELLAHHEWVTRLARQLAKGEAEDVVQDTWFAALRSPPGVDQPARPWLATVVRNVVRMRWRRDSRRGRWDQAFQAAVGPDHVDGVDQVYERMELQRFLAEAVLALEEPLRAVIVLRYVEGLDASQIGKLIGSPAGTVRWRLKTALDRLRLILDARCGGARRDWVAVLAPATVTPATVSPTLAPTTGVLLMANVKLKIWLAAVVVLALLAISGTALWRTRTAGPGAGAESGARDRAGQPLRTGGPVVASELSGAPASSNPAGVGQTPGATRAGAAGLSGRVVDSGGGAIPGARVVAGVLRGDTPVVAAIADDNGRYALQLPPGDYRFQAGAEGYAAARFSVYLHLPMVRDFRLHAASRIGGRVLARSTGKPLARAEVSLVDTQSLELGMVTRTTLADDNGAFSFSSMDPSAYRLIAHAGPLVGQHPTPVVVGLGQDVSVDVFIDRGRTVRGSVQTGDGAGLPEIDVLVPFGPVEFMSARQPGVRARTDGEGRFFLEGLPPVALELLATGARGKARKAINLSTGDLQDVRLVLAAQGSVTGVVLDAGRRPVDNARVVASTANSNPGTGAEAASTDQRGFFRIEGLLPGSLTVAAIHPAGIAEVAGLLEPDVVKHVEIVLGSGANVSGTVRRQDGTPAAGAQVFAFAGGWAPRNWGQPTAATRAAPDGSYRIDSLPSGEVLVRAVNPGDEPFAGLDSRQARPDRVPLVLGNAEQKTGVDLVVLRNDLTISGRVIDEEGRPVPGGTLNAVPDGTGAPVGQGRTLSQADGQFVIDGLSSGPHAVVLAHPDFPETRREQVAAGSTAIELRLQRGGSIAGVVIGQGGQPATLYTIVARLTLDAQATEQQLRTNWNRPPLRTTVLSQPDGAFTFTSVPAGSYEVVAYFPDRSVATSPPVAVAPGQRRTDVRLVWQPSATLRGRVIDHRTGQPLVGARAEGRGTATGTLSAVTDAAGWFSLEGLPAGKTADFAIVGPGGGFLTDCQHRLMPAKGGTVEIGDVRLFPGPAHQLTLVGAAATGLWFHSQEGRPTVHSVRPGSPAAAAGARNGEPVLAVDDTDVRQLSSSVVEGLVATGGRSIQLTVQSPGGPRTLAVPRVERGTR